MSGQSEIEIIGNFTDLKALAVANLLGKTFYMSMLKHKDDLVKESNIEGILRPFETLYMVIHAKKEKGEKYTYKDDKVTKDPFTGGVTVEKDIEQPVKKFANITSEVKNGLIFILNQYIKECHDYYKSSKNKFPEKTQVLAKICEFSEKQSPNAIAPIIIKSSDVIDIEKLVEGSYNQCLKNLTDKVRKYFKDNVDDAPDEQLNSIVNAYIRFMKIIAIMMTDCLFEKRQALSGFFFFGMLRQINSIMKQHKCRIEEETFDNMRRFIEANKPKGKGKKEDEENEEEDIEEKPKKKSSPKGKTTKAKTTKTKSTPEVEKKSGTGRGRPKGKTPTKSKESAKPDSEEEIDNEEEINNAFEEIEENEGVDWKDAVVDD